MTEEISMPEDWNDHEGWERYYASLFPNGSRVPPSLINEMQSEDGLFDFYLRIWTCLIGDKRGLIDFVHELKADKVETIWVSGCGISLLPKLLARAGFTVHATDVSPTAIEFQKSSEAEIENTLDKIIEPSVSTGSLACEVHDFRQRYLDNYFDFIINVRAFQKFDYETMKQVGKVHYNSLKPSRTALFYGKHLRGELLDRFRESLHSVGFLIPEYETTRWFEVKLKEITIERIEGENDGDYLMHYLESISPEHGRRILGERAAQKGYLEANPDTRIAKIAYDSA